MIFADIDTAFHNIRTVSAIYLLIIDIFYVIMMLLLETYTMKSPLKVELDSNESKTRVLMVVSTQISNNLTNTEKLGKKRKKKLVAWDY